MQVSIVIPCYNRAALIGDAIDSAITNGDGAEVIVIDDGSTDDSWERIQSFGDQVRAFRIPNGGVSAARNFGIKQATGTYIRFLDSDDRLPPRGIAALVAAKRTVAPHQIVFGDASSISLAGDEINPSGYGYAAVASAGPLSRAVLLSRIMSPLLPLYPSEALKRIDGFDPAYNLGEDQELAVRLVLAGYEFYRIPVLVAEVREHPGDRLSRGNAVALHDGHVTLYAAIINLFENSKAPLVSNEALSLARTIWTVARDAARAKCRMQAKRLFQLSAKMAHPSLVAPARLRLLYWWLDPYYVEHIIEIFKSARR